MATRINPTNFGYQNFYSAVLTADMTAGALSASLDTVPTPSSGILVIDPDSTTSREVVLYTSKGASTVTFPSDGRGYSGSTTAAHLTGTTVIMAPIDKWFTALASGELSTDPLRTELFYDYVASGMVWTGDSYGGSRNASMTSGVIYINGRRLTATAVAARSFTASKDTYIDASDATADGVVTLTYTEVANNAASPALAANSVRIGIIVTAAGSIAAAGSVNQGEETKVLPIASSIAYTTTDSLGNLICPRDPLRKVLGYRQITSNFATTSSTAVQVTGLTCPVIVPTGRKIRISVIAGYVANTTTSFITNVSIYDGVVAVGPLLYIAQSWTSTNNFGQPVNVAVPNTPSSASKTFNAGLSVVGGGTSTMSAQASAPAYILVELV